jgi:hypothetical protein
MSIPALAWARPGSILVEVRMVEWKETCCPARLSASLRICSLSACSVCVGCSSQLAFAVCLVSLSTPLITHYSCPSKRLLLSSPPHYCRLPYITPLQQQHNSLQSPTSVDFAHSLAVHGAAHAVAADVTAACSVVAFCPLPSAATTTALLTHSGTAISLRDPTC